MQSLLGNLKKNIAKKTASFIIADEFAWSIFDSLVEETNLSRSFLFFFEKKLIIFPQ